MKKFPYTGVTPGATDGKHWNGQGKARGLWEFFIEKQTNPNGLVNYGHPITYEWIRARVPNCPPRRTLARWVAELRDTCSGCGRGRLFKGLCIGRRNSAGELLSAPCGGTLGYISTRFVPYAGFVVRVLKAKKWAPQLQMDFGTIPSAMRPAAKRAAPACAQLVEFQRKSGEFAVDSPQTQRATSGTVQRATSGELGASTSLYVLKRTSEEAKSSTAEEQEQQSQDFFQRELQRVAEEKKIR